MKSFGQNYDKLIDHMQGIEVIDSHEHLPQEAERLATNPDFSKMFGHYCQSEMLSVGMTRAELQSFLGESMPVEEKWALFEPYYRMIQDGSYARAAHIAIEKFYGMGRLTSLADALTLTKEIRSANKPGLYDRVLKEACNIRVSMNYCGTTDQQDSRYFEPVVFATGYVEVTRNTIRGLEDEMQVSCGNLDSYVDAVREKQRILKEQGNKGIKFHLAYMRDLQFAARTHAEAEQVFLRIMEEGYGRRHTDLGYEEMRPLQDYMVHRFVEIAGEMDLPIVFHTGLQGDVDSNADDCRPLRLWNLPHRYRNTDFLILHGGFPWLEDAALLAKQYENVYLDLAWAHLMSPEIVARSLRSWVDMIPMHKILGFGGDYCVVEKVYGQLVLAKQNIGSALAAKMDDGALSFDRAKAWIQAMFYDNPNRLFRLGK